MKRVEINRESERRLFVEMPIIRAAEVSRGDNLDNGSHGRREKRVAKW